MRTKRFLVLFSAAAVLVFGECVQAPETRKSLLQVAAFDPTGAPLPDVEIELTAVGGDEIVRMQAKEARVLYGDHQLRVHARGFRSVTREIHVQQPEMQVRVELEVALECPSPPAEIRGRVKRNGAERDLWVKAIPVRGAGGSESRVTKSGYFLIAGLKASTYIVLVMDGEQVVHQQVVQPLSGESATLAIDLQERR